MRLVIVSILVAAASGAAISPVKEGLENNSTTGILESEANIVFRKDVYDKQNKNRNEEQTANANEGNKEETTGVTESVSWVTESDINTTVDINDETTTQYTTDLISVERVIPFEILSSALG